MTIYKVYLNGTLAFTTIRCDELIVRDGAFIFFRDTDEPDLPYAVYSVNRFYIVKEV